jgi:hypothetical protein
MAFNPFRGFRKNQKTIMALVTVMCMIIFVFQFGAGDVFQRALNWFGSFGRKGNDVLALYGSTVTDRELDDVKRQRKLANQFMQSVTLSHMESVAKRVEGRGEADDKGPLSGPIGMVARRLSAHARQVQMALRMRQVPPPAGNIDTDLAAIRDELNFPGAGKDRDRLRALESAANLAALFAWMSTGEAIFGGGLNGQFSNQDALDFLIWKNQADRLGITLTDADIAREANLMAGVDVFGDVAFDQVPDVQGFLSLERPDRKAGPIDTPATLLSALRDELRVQVAQESILGHGTGWRYWYNRTEPTRVSPSVATPYEFFDYFRDQRTTLKVALLAVPTTAFLDGVTGRPNEEELRNLYEKYKGEERKPEEPRPGFKEPRRVRLQYLRVDPESKFYKDESEKLAKAVSVYSDPRLSAAMRFMAGYSATRNAGFPDLPGLVALPSAVDPLGEAYQDYLRQWRTPLFNLPFGLDWRNPKPVAERELTWASVIGMTLTANQTGSPLVAHAAIQMVGNLLAFEAQMAATTAVALGSDMLAGGGSPLAAITLPLPFWARAMPLWAPPGSSEQAAWTHLLDKFRTELAPKLAFENLRTFETKLAEAQKNGEDMDSFLAKAVKDYDFQDLGAMPKPVSIYELDDDPSLKKFADVYHESQSKMDAQARAQAFQLSMQNPGMFQQFYDILRGQYPPTLRQFVERSPEGKYVPQTIPGPGDSATASTWVVWRSEDIAAENKSFDKARPEVAQAWRVDRARRLAEAEAERIKKHITDNKFSWEDAVKYFRDQKLGKEVELDNVARLVPLTGDLLSGRRVGDMNEYVPPKDKLRYPPADLVDKLMTLKSPGDALVFADRPLDHYYVAVLESRSPPTFSANSEFERALDSTTLSPIYRKMQEKIEHDRDQQLIKQMRVEAAGKDNIDDKGRIKLPPNLRGDQKDRDVARE